MADQLLGPITRKRVGSASLCVGNKCYGTTVNELDVPVVHTVSHKQHMTMKQKLEDERRKLEQEIARVQSAITENWENGWTEFYTSSYGGFPCGRELEDKGYKIIRQPYLLLSSPPQSVYKIVWDPSKLPTNTPISIDQRM